MQEKAPAGFLPLSPADQYWPQYSHIRSSPGSHDYWSSDHPNEYRRVSYLSDYARMETIHTLNQEN